MNIDSKKIRELRGEIDQALEVLAKKHGLQIKAGNAKYDPHGQFCTFQLECSVLDENNQAKTQEAVDFERMANLYNLKPEDLGKTIVVHGTEYTIEGLKPRSSKYPICVSRNSDGRKFKLVADWVRSALKR